MEIGLADEIEPTVALPMVQEIMRHILELELLAALDESADPELGLAVLELE